MSVDEVISLMQLIAQLNLTVRRLEAENVKLREAVAVGLWLIAEAEQQPANVTPLEARG